MATTVTSTEIIGGTVSSGRRSGNGNGFSKNGGGRAGGPMRDPAARYRIGAWVLIASVVMLFTALSSAYIVRSASSDDWHPIAMPRVLWLSTALILISSITLEVSRRSLKQQLDAAYSGWLLLTGLLGLGFLSSQLFAWRQLVRQGVYLAGNPHSSFFYLLTAAHGLHLLGGILALSYLVMRTRKRRDTVEGEARRAGAADAVTIYWHFMDVLWIYLFLLLFFWK
jgi:cytochrome c oxidase subunit 3